MKHRPFEEFKVFMDEFEVTSIWPKHIGNADHNDSALGTLIEVDAKLKSFGLEIVMYETKSDFDAWEIVNIDEGTIAKKDAEIAKLKAEIRYTELSSKWEDGCMK